MQLYQLNVESSKWNRTNSGAP